MSAQRATSAKEPTHRSIHPNIPGVPWWAALLIATTATAIGYAIDASGRRELTHVFAVLYVAGCVAAVLAVRQEGLFTAVIQPPLILFCAVPGAYWLFHGRKIGSLKDLLINCGYPLIERFPLMLGAAGGVLLIGLFRWYFGMSRRTTSAANDPDAATTTGQKSNFRGIAGKLNSILGLASHGRDDRAREAAATDLPRAHASGTPQKPSRGARSSRSAGRTSRSRSQHDRPLEDQHGLRESSAERPRRRRQAPPRDFDPAEPPRRSRRPRPETDPDFRAQVPREMRQEPRGRRNPYAPYAPYEPHEPHEQPRRRAAPNGANGANPTHHPISRVRYRGSGSGVERDQQRDDPRAPRRDRSEK